MPYHLLHSDVRLKHQLENTNFVELVLFSKFLLNRSKLGKTFNMRKQRIFIRFPMPYHLPQLDQPFRNDIENMNSAVRFAKFYDFPNYSLTIENQRKLSTCRRSGFAAAFQGHIICLIPINGLEMRSNIRFTFLCEERMVFQTALKPLTFCQNFKLGHDTDVHSYPTVYRKPHLVTFQLKFNLVLGEGQARYSGSSCCDQNIILIP